MCINIASDEYFLWKLSVSKWNDEPLLTQPLRLVLRISTELYFNINVDFSQYKADKFFLLLDKLISVLK